MIQVNNVTKVYDESVVALRDVSFRVKKGTVKGVIGRNGSGKSTLFKVISGVISDFEGGCLINGEPVSLDYSQSISYLPEVRGLDGRKQVLEHLTDLVCYKGIKRKVAQKSVRTWLERFSLSHAKYHKINTLSKGNQQKLQFIVAVASNPQLLILDEPFSGLDPITGELLWEIIESLREKGCTVVFSSHNLYEAMSRCDEFIFIKEGQIVEEGPLEEIQSNYSMILEVQNNSLNNMILQNMLMDVSYKIQDDTYLINVNSVEDARVIFNHLPNKFSTVFNLRKMNLNELFKEINRKGDRS